MHFQHVEALEALQKGSSLDWRVGVLPSGWDPGDGSIVPS